MVENQGKIGKVEGNGEPLATRGKYSEPPVVGTERWEDVDTVQDEFRLFYGMGKKKGVIRSNIKIGNEKAVLLNFRGKWVQPFEKKPKDIIQIVKSEGDRFAIEFLENITYSALDRKMGRAVASAAFEAIHGASNSSNSFDADSIVQSVRSAALDIVKSEEKVDEKVAGMALVLDNGDKSVSIERIGDGMKCFKIIKDKSGQFRIAEISESGLYKDGEVILVMSKGAIDIIEEVEVPGAAHVKKVVEEDVLEGLEPDERFESRMKILFSQCFSGEKFDKEKFVDLYKKMVDQRIGRLNLEDVGTIFIA